MTAAATAPTAAIDLKALKTKQHAAWTAGDYARIGSTLQLVGEELAEAFAPSSGDRVLDVAAGNGNATLAFARRFCDVTSTDYVPALLEKGRARAEAEGFDVAYREEDAESLSFDDGSFDGVVSAFGVMFTPDQRAAASEMRRVCRAGGTIAMANWTPDCFVGRLFRVVASHTKPPAGAPNPFNWGDEAWVRSEFGADASAISIEPASFDFRYRSGEHFVEFFRTHYGPTQRAFDALDDAGKAALERDLLALIAELNEATDGTMRVPSPYLRIVITRK